MLRILRIDVEAPWVVLILQGQIVAEWAAFLESECLELSRSGLRVVLDLSGVIFIGLTGLKVLGRLNGKGVGIAGCSPSIADMLEEEGIEVNRKVRATKEG